MRRLVLAALIAGVATVSAGNTQLSRVDVSLGDVSINKVPQLVAADQGIYAKLPAFRFTAKIRRVMVDVSASTS
jgi:hypothetical protein